MNSSKIPQTPGAPAGDSEAGAGAGGVTGTLAQAKQNVTQTARDTAAKIKSVAGETAARARQEVGRMAQDKKETAANRVGGYGSALHNTAKSLEEQDPNIAWFAHQAADRLEGVANYVRSRDFAGLRTDAEGVARRHPAAFFGGLFVAGLVLGNVLKASQRKARTSDLHQEGAYGGSGDWPGGSEMQEPPAAPDPNRAQSSAGI